MPNAINEKTSLRTTTEPADSLNWIDTLHSELGYFLELQNEFDQLFSRFDPTHPVIARQTIAQLDSQFELIRTLVDDRPDSFPIGERELRVRQPTEDSLTETLNDLQESFDTAHTAFQNYVLPNLPSDTDRTFDDRVAAFSGMKSHEDVNGLINENSRSDAVNTRETIQNVFKTHGYLDYPDRTRDNDMGDSDIETAAVQNTSGTPDTSESESKTHTPPTTTEEASGAGATGTTEDSPSGTPTEPSNTIQTASKPPKGAIIQNIRPVRPENYRDFPSCSLPSCDTDAVAKTDWEDSGEHGTYLSCRTHAPRKATAFVSHSRVFKHGRLQSSEYSVSTDAAPMNGDGPEYKWTETHCDGDAESPETIIARVEYEFVSISGEDMIEVTLYDYQSETSRRMKYRVDVDRFEGCVPYVGDVPIGTWLQQKGSEHVRTVRPGDDDEYHYLVPAHKDLSSVYRAIDRMRDDGGENPEDYWPVCADCSVAVGGSVEEPLPCEKCGGWNIIPASECDATSLIEIDDSVKLF